MLLLSLLAYGILGTITVFVAENTPDMSVERQTLYDVIHEYVPHFPNPSIVTLMVSLSMIYTVLRWCLVDTRIVAVYFFALAILLAVRLFTFTMTQTPPPNRLDDKWRVAHCKRTLLSHIGLNFREIDDTCIDNMFSGHAVTTVGAMVIILLFSNSKIEKIVGSIIASAIAFMVITSRLHYTADVVVGSALVIMLIPLIRIIIFTRT